jgi:hypothetical protein
MTIRFPPDNLAGVIYTSVPASGIHDNFCEPGSAALLFVRLRELRRGIRR